MIEMIIQAHPYVVFNLTYSSLSFICTIITLLAFLETEAVDYL